VALPYGKSPIPHPLRYSAYPLITALIPACAEPTSGTAKRISRAPWPARSLTPVCRTVGRSDCLTEGSSMP
jgi:hypothetical protein